MDTDGTRRAPLITLADIAELAGVRRSAVSNWRKRFRDFPQPTAGTAGSPLFDTRQVEDWLRRSDRYVGRPGLEQQIWRSMDRLRNHAPPGALYEAFCAAVVMQYVAVQPQRADNLARGARLTIPFRDMVQRGDPHGRLLQLKLVASELEFRAPSLNGVFLPAFDRLPEEAADLLVMLDDASERDPVNMFETFLGMHLRATGRGSADWTTSETLAELMIELGRPFHDIVYDPAAGSGGLLVAASHAAKRRVLLIGQEVNETAWRLANQRIIVHGLDGRVERGDTLQCDKAPELLATTVLLHPPYGMRNWGAERLLDDHRWRFGLPTGTSADMAWLQHAVAHLAPGGRAFVLLPNGSLFREGQYASVRHELVRQGAVEAILSLPQGLAPRTSISLALWVLARPGDTAVKDRVLLIDAAAVGRKSFTDGIPEIVELYHGWRDAGRLNDVGWAAAPELLELLAVGATLVPSHWIPSATESVGTAQIVAELEHGTHQLANRLAELGDVPNLQLNDLAEPTGEARRVSVSRLAADELVGLYRGVRISREEMTNDGDGLPLLTSGQLREGIEAWPGEHPRIAEDLLDRPPVVADVGDVVVLTEGPRVRSLVVREGGAVVVAPLWLLKVRSQLIDPYYLAACLASEWNSRHSTGTTVLRSNIRDLEVPLLPLETQRTLAERLRLLDDIQRRCTDADRLARSIRQQLVDGIAAGVVEIGRLSDG